MAKEKAPAFQFYPKDYLSDPRVRSMTFEQRGLYWEAICLCWMEGTLPADPAELAAILRCPLKRIRKIWPLVGRCFDQHGDRLTHKRLDKERTAQADSRERRADAARKRWEKEQKADAMHMQSNAGEQLPVDAMQCSPSPSSSTTSSASSTAVRETAKIQPLINRRESMNWDKKHGYHVTGFCGWCCLDEQQLSEFAAKIPGDDHALKSKQVIEWATDIRRQWSDRIIPDGSHFDFWRNRWTETHGGSRPANATLKAAKAASDLDEAFR